MDDLAAAVEVVAADTHFSGVVRVDRDGAVLLSAAYGSAHRGHEVPNTVDQQFGIASGTKGLTALTVVSLVEQGELDLDTRARRFLGPDLPLIDDEVTVEHLLAHTSGIGDYLDEEQVLDLDDHLIPVPVHELGDTEQYRHVLDGHAPKFEPGGRFAYSNSGYVVLALIAERATATSFYELVEQRVCSPAGMRDTVFLCSDDLPGRAAVGYLAAEGGRSNVLHLPVRGSGDGGAYSTVADVHALWDALFAGRIVSPAWVAEMVCPRQRVPSQGMRHGLGFWLHESGPAVILEGCDTGVSFRSVHDPLRRTTHTVLSNTTDGAWPLTRLLDELLTP